MRKIGLLFVIAILITITGWSQELIEFDYIAPFNDGMAAVKKGEQWGFINEDGQQVINFRNDLVLKDFKTKSYPLFSDGRALIAETKDGIKYFGYIDKTGSKVDTPEFLNATHFQDGYAIVLELIKRDVGKNRMLKKPLVSYEYFEAMIDPDGNIVHYLTEEPVHITLDKDFLTEVPNITSKVIAENVIAQLNANKKWVIIKLE